MDTSSAISAPATDAGQSNGNQDSTADRNSAVDNQPTQRQDRGAESQTPKKPAPVKAKPATAEDDDPEWDFGNGKKYKRSHVTKRLSEQARGAQQERDAHKAAREKLEARDAHLKDLGVDLEMFEKDPKAALRKAAHDHLARELEEATRDPREIALEKAEKRAADLEKLEADRAEETRKTAHQKEVDAAHDNLAGSIATALEEHKLPKHPYVVVQALELLKAARNSNKRLSFAEAAEKVNGTVNDVIDQVLPEGNPQAIVDRLGPKRIEEAAEYLRLKSQSKFNPQPKTPRAPATREFQPKSHPVYMTLDEIKAADRLAKAKR